MRVAIIQSVDCFRRYRFPCDRLLDRRNAITWASFNKHSVRVARHKLLFDFVCDIVFLSLPSHSLFSVYYRCTLFDLQFLPLWAFPCLGLWRHLHILTPQSSQAGDVLIWSSLRLAWFLCSICLLNALESWNFLPGCAILSRGIECTNQ